MEQLPLAVVGGEPWLEPPQGLFIPPNALRVLLAQFEGPLDLLLYLIRKNRFDLMNIPVAEVSRQYMQYLTMMQTLEIELAAEYLLMAAWLTEIKSRLLLPRPVVAEGEDAQEEDPRAALVERLLAFQMYQQLAIWLDEQPRAGREVETLSALAVDAEQLVKPPLRLQGLLDAWVAVLRREDVRAPHQVSEPGLTLEQRLADIEAMLHPGARLPWVTFLLPELGREGLVLTFVALLELLRQGRVQLWQEATCMDGFGVLVP